MIPCLIRLVLPPRAAQIVIIEMKNMISIRSDMEKGEKDDQASQT